MQYKSRFFRNSFVALAMACGVWGLCAFVSASFFSDLRSTFDLATGGDVSVIVDTRRPELVDKDWLQCNLDIRNISCKRIQVQGIQENCNLFLGAKMPIGINALGRHRQALVIRREAITEPMKIEIFVNGEKRLVSFHVPEAFLPKQNIVSSNQEFLKSILEQ